MVVWCALSVVVHPYSCNFLLLLYVTICFLLCLGDCTILLMLLFLARMLYTAFILVVIKSSLPFSHYHIVLLYLSWGFFKDNFSTLPDPNLWEFMGYVVVTHIFHIIAVCKHSNFLHINIVLWMPCLGHTWILKLGAKQVVPFPSPLLGLQLGAGIKTRRHVLHRPWFMSWSAALTRNILPDCSCLYFI